MSAATVAAVPARGTIPGPVIRVARLHLVAWPAAMLWPWGILGLSFAVNLLIWGRRTPVASRSPSGCR